MEHDFGHLLFFIDDYTIKTKTKTKKKIKIKIK